MARLAPYYEQHKLENVRGPGDSRPTASQIIKDEGLVDSPEWAGRVVLITGVSPGGLGVETAKAIHLTGADVYITTRNLAKGKEVAEEIRADGKPGKVDVVQLELDSLDSIRTAAAEFLEKSGNKLNVLINNAGMYPRTAICQTYANSGRNHGLPQGPNEGWLRVAVRYQPLGYVFRLLMRAIVGSNIFQATSCSFNFSRMLFWLQQARRLTPASYRCLPAPTGQARSTLMTSTSKTPSTSRLGPTANLNLPTYSSQTS